MRFACEALQKYCSKHSKAVSESEKKKLCLHALFVALCPSGTMQ